MRLPVKRAIRVMFQHVDLHKPHFGNRHIEISLKGGDLTRQAVLPHVICLRLGLSLFEVFDGELQLRSCVGRQPIYLIALGNKFFKDRLKSMSFKICPVLHLLCLFSAISFQSPYMRFRCVHNSCLALRHCHRHLQITNLAVFPNSSLLIGISLSLNATW